MPKIEELINYLEKIGFFNKLEIKILSIMLEKFYKEKKKIFDANEIAKLCGMSVTNTYKYLYSLQEKGIIESSKGNIGSNKKFWITQSCNPIPRILSKITAEYIEKKKNCAVCEKLWNWFVPQEKIWNDQKVYEKYENGFIDKAALIIDIAKKDIIITFDKFFDNINILDALGRAVNRNVHIRAILEQIHPDQSESLRKIGIELRLGKVWPYVIISDKMHGITYDPVTKSGVYFFNYPVNFYEKFEEFWKNSQEI
ncbi:MAG: hypothetical protein QXO19_00325 [Candidatus Aenigmatarchaeota archaeon]